MFLIHFIMSGNALGKAGSFILRDEAVLSLVKPEPAKQTSPGNFIFSAHHKSVPLYKRVMQGLLKWKLKRLLSKENQKTSKGIPPLILSITGVVMVFIPVLWPAALVCLLTAIIYGKHVKRKYPGDKTAASAVGLGWAGLVLLAGALLLSAFSSIQYLKFD